MIEAIPVWPDSLDRITEAWLNRWAEWVAAGRPLVESYDGAEVEKFDPALHPRDPETGQFVERPFDVPSDAPDFGGMSTKETLTYLDENDANVSAVFDPESEVTVDGVPNRATSIDDVPDDPEEANPEPVGDTAPDDAHFTRDDHEEWESTTLDDITSRQSIYDADDASTGVTATSMEVVELEDGTTGFVTHYGDDADLPADADAVDGADPRTADRQMIAYEGSRRIGAELDDELAAFIGNTVPPHTHIDGDGSHEAVIGEEFDGDRVWGAAGQSVDEAMAIDAAAVQMIVGNNDAHGDNVMVDDDGNLGFIDIDHSAGRLSNEDPGTGSGNNADRALNRAAKSLEVVTSLSHSELERDILNRSRALARELDTEAFKSELREELSAWDDELVENVVVNIEELADPNMTVTR
ncbi:hypothetical protein Z052_02010 [Halorubrum sp. C191]|nr:hypothetical protein Z052_02010 [Halorubrum sp. C191]